ncbi:MAG: hypothetical protein R3B13_26580 [Polyangiaceae bacterium]
MHPSPSVTMADCVLKREDLVHIDAFLDLLHCLNDPFASGHKITALVGKIPVLSARVIRRARGRSKRRQLDTVEQALTLIGNGGLESELILLLEELTILKAELED